MSGAKRRAPAREGAGSDGSKPTSPSNTLKVRMVRGSSHQSGGSRVMRKLLLVSSIAVVAAGVAVAASAGAKGTRGVKFPDTAVGGSITDTRAAFSVHDSYMGDGAGVQTVKLTGTTGTDTTIVYYGDATASSK